MVPNDEQRAVFASAWKRFLRDCHAARLDGTGFLPLLRPALAESLRKQPATVAIWWARELEKDLRGSDEASRSGSS